MLRPGAPAGFKNVDAQPVGSGTNIILITIAIGPRTEMAQSIITESGS